MAARCANSHERTACRADLWPRLLLFAVEKSAHRVLPFFHTHLPLIGKGQFSSLRPANGVPIIPKSPFFFSERRLFRGHSGHGQIRGVWQTHRRRTHAGEEFRERRGRAGNRKAHGAVFARSFRETYRGGGLDRSAQRGAHRAERPESTGRAAAAESANFMTRARP